MTVLPFWPLWGTHTHTCLHVHWMRLLLFHLLPWCYLVSSQWGSTWFCFKNTLNLFGKMPFLGDHEC